jgi:hypothetical protein
MMTLQVGKHYRDKVSGVTGRAIGVSVDAEYRREGDGHIPMTGASLDLHPEHREVAPSGRWYPEHRLEEIPDPVTAGVDQQNG